MPNLAAEAVRWRAADLADQVEEIGEQLEQAIEEGSA